MKRPASLIISILLIFMASAQLLRFIMKINVTAAGIEIPVWPSAVAAVVLLMLATWLFKERNS